ncbi:MAG TPA: hypothetical protein VM764_04350 [Gemmatimonadaceae bacterium]|nr:hypothetical protein [Gemmatimonadaceae bacterium]
MRNLPDNLANLAKRGLVQISKNNPTAADVHTSTTLTDWASQYANDRADFAADALAPIVTSSKDTGYYYKYTKADWFRDEMKVRGEGGDIPMAGYRLSKTPFGIDVWSVGKPIDDQTRDAEDEPIDSDTDAVEFVTDLELIRRERAMVAAAFGTTIWGTDVTGNTSASNYGSNTVAQWDDTDSSPLEDIANYREVVKKSTGLYPNVLAIGADVWKVLKNHADILARITGGSNNADPAKITKQMVAGIMELDELVVLSSVYTADEETSAGTMTGEFIAGKVGLLMHRNPNPGRKKPTAMRTFVWQRPGCDARGTRIIRWPNVKPHVDVVEIESNFRHVVTAPDLGVYFATLVG